MQKVFPNTNSAQLKKIADLVNKYGKDFGIDNKEKIQHFLAQAFVETGGLKTLQVTENLYYTTASLIPKRYGKFTMDKKKYPDRLYAGDYIRNPKKLANVVMCCKYGNGDEKSGDGWRYRGRGIFQLTWKSNYESFTKWYNNHYSPKKDFVKNPNLISTDNKFAILSGMWYFKAKVLDRLKGKKLTVDNITKKVNKAKLKIKKRENEFEKAQKIIKCR